jgi:hypothetical protein
VPDFKGIIRAEYDALLDHLVHHDFLYEAGGKYSPGDKTERMFGRKSFAELYAVFSAPVIYRVMVGKLSHCLRQFHRDLDTLGFRWRRQQDGRRTLISLARSDGANAELLRWCTYGPQGMIMDVYTTPTWDALCGEVAKLLLPPPPADEIAPCAEDDEPAPKSIDMGSVTLLLRSNSIHEKGS